MIIIIITTIEGVVKQGANILLSFWDHGVILPAWVSMLSLTTAGFHWGQVGLQCLPFNSLERVPYM